VKEDTRKELSNEAERPLTPQEEAEFFLMVEVLEERHAIDQARKGNTLFLIDYLQRGVILTTACGTICLMFFCTRCPFPSPGPRWKRRTASMGASRSKWRWVSILEVVGPKRRPVFWRPAG